jgi:hypothetical protein
MYKYGYTQSTKMPGPEIGVEVLSAYRSGRSRAVTCVIDTAATVSVLPLFLVDELQLGDYTSSSVTWGSGDSTMEKKYLVDLRISGRLFSGLYVVMIKRPKGYGLIGRDILNTHLLTCDGPGGTWRVEPEWV